VKPGPLRVTPRLVPSLPATLDGSTRVGPYSAARPGMLLRVVPGVGRFLASGGTALEYWTEPGADRAAVEALLQGGVLGALMHQRGELPLHATTLVSPGRKVAVALAGGSGAGKSTTAYELIRRGWTMLSDDLTRVTISGGVPVAWPGRSKLRLVADACSSFGVDVGTLAPAPNWPGKYVLDVPRWPEPVELRAVVVLDRVRGSLRIVTVRGAAAAGTLAKQTYRLHYVAALGQTQLHLSLVAATAAHATVLRARGQAPVAEVADALEVAVGECQAPVRSCGS
jgi:hypothetical protein